MYLEIFLADFAVFRVFEGISRDFVEIPEFRGSATARNIRSPVKSTINSKQPGFFFIYIHNVRFWFMGPCVKSFLSYKFDRPERIHV